MIKKVPSEDWEQGELRKILDAAGLVWCHVPNGGKRSKITAAILTALGVKKGVPDVLIFTRPPKHPNAPGTAVEMKRVLGGVLSTDQKRWLRDLADLGWMTSRCNGYLAAVAYLKSLGYDLGG